MYHIHTNPMAQKTTPRWLGSKYHICIEPRHQTIAWPRKAPRHQTIAWPRKAHALYIWVGGC